LPNVGVSIDEAAKAFDVSSQAVNDLESFLEKIGGAVDTRSMGFALSMVVLRPRSRFANR